QIPDMPTQLWLLARYLTAAALLAASAFIGRRLSRPGFAAGLFGAAAAAGLLAIITGVFPTAFVEGSGLTAFKIVSEYVITGLFVVGLVLVWRRRVALPTGVFRLLAAAITFSIVAELLFTTYTDVYGITNMLGHVAYLLSFYLLFLALVDVALRRPYESLFGELAARERSLRSAHHFSEGLNEIDNAIHATLDPDEVLRRVVETSTRVIGADAAVLGTFDGERYAPRYVTGYTGDEFRGLDLDRDAGRHIFRAREIDRPLVIDDVRGDGSVSRDFIEATGVTAILANVLTIRDEVVGGFGFHWRSGPHTISGAEIDFSRRVSSSLSLALDNARAYMRQHGIAEALQTDMASVAVDAPGVDVGQVYVPAPGAGRIGGDFYDVFALDDGRLAFLLGDVAGRGLTAASKNAMVRSTVRALAVVQPDPAVVLSRAGDVLARQFALGEFATAVFGLIDPLSGLVDVAVAGHPLPLVASRDGAWQPEIEPGLPLGLGASPGPASWRASLRSGETLLLFTDGAYEARRGDDFFGEERLRAAVEQAAALPTAQAVADAVLAEVKEYAGDIRDDLALLSLRYTGPTTLADARPDAEVPGRVTPDDLKTAASPHTP
ncbi:MAG TPA: SpoIIE family protein phosphatase, partial [Thermoleophilia bacterium]|nr:SpoIIE family protein phosphatase [Thermoleophilia bacterium]